MAQSMQSSGGVVFQLPGDRIITGKASHATRKITPYAPQTLIIGLPGGCYDAKYFDAHPTASPLKLAEDLDIPFVALNRPSYSGSSPMPEYDASKQTWMQAQGPYIVETIVPAVLKTVSDAVPIKNVVLYGHGTGAAIVTIAAAAYSKTFKSGNPLPYTLAGVIVSSIASSAAVGGPAPPTIADGPTGFPIDVKDAVMINGPGRDFAPEEVFALSPEIDQAAPQAEFYDIAWQWSTYWEKYAQEVEVPVLHMLEESGPMWGPDGRAKQAEFVGALQKLKNGRGPAASTMLVAHAPHCLELSHAAQQVVLSAFGWAVATGRAKEFERSTS
ncbi:hypothetical protein NA57DRAFT_56652 [Rhizodiscina lignyota]|uniref:AB hydrolase-1 domain-containing protein n=1 Tax=Rhizodiscina lignyota TaxID=1504668 RepID=A0A9P4MAT0_9PEZI|nr:hypothetical protein NA57DRAFT_56652 [Rhizodiscina lignyota]